jgi:predicted dehydrogenase
MEGRVRWGILGTAKIAREKVVPALFKARNAEVVAIASRSTEVAEREAASLRIPRAHGSYEGLLADTDVDAIYVPLPNHLHVDWSIRALEAGKHVLCEKPLGLDAADAQRLVDAARRHPDRVVMEAFMIRFHPQWRFARHLVDEGRIGALVSVHAHFSYRKTDPLDIRNQVGAGGGGLLDIGVYDVSSSRFLFGEEPRRVVAAVDHDPSLGIDRLASALLDFGDGRVATFTCGTQHAPYQRVHAFGGDGRIEIEIPFNAPQDGPCRLWHTAADGWCERVFDRVDQYALQAEAFGDAVLAGEPAPLALDDAVANLRVLDAIVESARRREWVELA